MKQLTGSEIRSMFLKYFEERGHMVEPGASLVPHNDPTLLWINAGVAALKKYFDGSEKPRCNRITNAQKSIRTNDIENVGKTARHHTFFEMLGNFSIGDYFKQEAIPFAWEFLTSPEWIGFDKEKMYVTIYEDGEAAYFSNLPIKAMVQEMKENGIPAAVSNTAGTFVCNHVMYGVLYLIDKKYPGVKGGFIHVPFIPAQTLDKPDKPAMNINDIAKGLELCIKAAVENSEDIKAVGGAVC